MYRAKDIAAMLNLSPAAVSLVLNNKPGVSEEVRHTVLDKIKELGCEYLLKRITPNGKTIGFVIYKRHGRIIGQSPFFSLLIESIDNHARKHGYSITIIHIDKTSLLESQIEYIKSCNCAGLIIFATEMLSEDLSEIKALNIPFVITDNYFVEEAVDSVAINNEQGTYEAVRHLYEMGHRKIGYLHSKIYLTSFQERKQYFFAALKKFGIKGMEKYVYSVGYPEDETCSDFIKILNTTKDLPTALFADNDIIAYGAMKALKEKGLRIPDDISIIGFDNRPTCLMTEPMLTTIDVPKDVFGALAVSALINKIESKYDGFLKTEIGTSLISRDSVKHLD